MISMSGELYFLLSETIVFRKTVDTGGTSAFKGIIHRFQKSWPLAFKHNFRVEATTACFWKFARQLVSAWTIFHRAPSLSCLTGAEIWCSHLCCLNEYCSKTKPWIENPSRKSLKLDPNFKLRKSKMGQHLRGVPEMHLKMNAFHNFRPISTLNLYFHVFAFVAIKNKFWHLWRKLPMFYFEFIAFFLES